jgi:hypothetical protein
MGCLNSRPQKQGKSDKSKPRPNSEYDDKSSEISKTSNFRATFNSDPTPHQSNKNSHRDSKKNQSQSLVSTNIQEQALKLMNVQETLNQVLVQLERLERVGESIVRNDGMPKDSIGDKRHIDLETNELALDTKVYCLKSILDQYKDDSLKSQCKSMIKKWQGEHQRSTKMNLYVQNVLSGLDRKGNLEVEDLKLTAKQRSKFQGRLVQGTRIYQDKISELESDPQAYIDGSQKYKLKLNK